MNFIEQVVFTKTTSLGIPAHDFLTVLAQIKIGKRHIDQYELSEIFLTAFFGFAIGILFDLVRLGDKTADDNRIFILPTIGAAIGALSQIPKALSD